MKNEYINPFLNATSNILKKVALIDPKPGKPFENKSRVVVGDISVNIGLTGAKTGAVTFSFSKLCALKVVSSMSGDKFTEESGQIQESVSEISSMIIEDARKTFSESGVKFEPGRPSVIVCEGHEVKSAGKGPCFTIPFKVEDAELVLGVSFEED